MLNYFLAQTTNPKLQKLLMLNLSFKKVFKTDEILLYLMLIYLNLSVILEIFSIKSFNNKA